MAKNRRKVYGEDEATRDAETKPCHVCGCRHFEVYRRDAETGKVEKRICRNCGTVVAACISKNGQK